MNKQMQSCKSLIPYKNITMHDVQFSGMNSKEEEDSRDNKDQLCLFSPPSFSLWEQALLRVAPTTMRQYSSWTKCSWAIGSAEAIQREGKSSVPPHSSWFLSHVLLHFSIPLQLRALAQGWKTQIRLKGADLAAGTESSPILHQSPQGKIQRDSDSGPGLSPARAVLRMENSKNFTRTLIVRSFFC